MFFVGIAEVAIPSSKKSRQGVEKDLISLHPIVVSNCAEMDSHCSLRYSGYLPLLFLDQMERAKVGVTTIRVRGKNGERDLVCKHSRGDLILVKEKGKTRSHIYTYATGLPSVRLFLTRLFAISATKGKAVSHRLTGNQKEKPNIA